MLLIPFRILAKVEKGVKCASAESKDVVNYIAINRYIGSMRKCVITTDRVRFVRHTSIKLQHSLLYICKYVFLEQLFK